MFSFFSYSKLKEDFEIEEAMIIETSIEGLNGHNELARNKIAEVCAKSNEYIPIVVHFGVYCGSGCFSLEQYGKNRKVNI